MRFQTQNQGEDDPGMLEVKRLITEAVAFDSKVDTVKLPNDITIHLLVEGRSPHCRDIYVGVLVPAGEMHLLAGTVIDLLVERDGAYTSHRVKRSTERAIILHQVIDNDLCQVTLDFTTGDVVKRILQRTTGASSVTHILPTS